MVITDVEAIGGTLDKRGLINLHYGPRMTNYEPARSTDRGFVMGERAGYSWNLLFTPQCTCGHASH